MHFQILKIILWSKKGLPKREVEFTRGVVNVISGSSKTGKSAVIPIIDYCLASDRCAIPVGVIREACSWFGVVIETLEGQKLLARREPGNNQQTGDMFLLEANEIEVPEEIPGKNTTAAQVKVLLDRVAGLPKLGFDPESDNSFKSRPSFRDLMAFTFQPQNIVANPDVMFFKADTSEHREKLKTIFPFVLDAVTADVLAARWEIDRLLRLVRRKESEQRASRSSVDAWFSEANAWIRTAVELGLLDSNISIPADWMSLVDLMRQIASSNSRSAKTSLSAIEFPLDRLQELRTLEGTYASDLSEARQRLSEIRRLISSSQSYGAAIRVQRDRLALSSWLSEKAAARSDALSVIGQQGQQDLSTLVSALAGIELSLRSHPTMSDTLERETLRLRADAQEAIEKLSSVRQEILLLERSSAEARAEAYRFDSIERFLGRLEQALTVYDKSGKDSDLEQELAALHKQVADLRGKISEQEIKRKIENALLTVQNHASKIIPNLDAEWPSAPIELLINDLTIKVIQGTRDDYLWEIGSGANWLAYHVATTLALQKFFLSIPNHPVPALLVYDQPSQVYFPRRTARSEEDLPDLKWKDEDVVAVRKVFEVLGGEVVEAKGRLQVIVLDHANEEVWGEITGVIKTEEWRGTKLVPNDWQ